MDFVSKSAEFVFIITFPLVFSRKILSWWRNLRLMDAMLIGREKEKSITVTTDGLIRNEYWGEVQAEIQLDDLYEL